MRFESLIAHSRFLQFRELIRRLAKNNGFFFAPIIFRGIISRRLGRLLPHPVPHLGTCRFMKVIVGNIDRNQLGLF